MSGVLQLHFLTKDDISTKNYAKLLQGRLAQLDRVLASEARCREFESHIAQIKSNTY